MNYVNSDFMSGVNPLNQNNFSAAQQNALTSLAPNGIGLMNAQAETPINLSIPNPPKIYPTGGAPVSGGTSTPTGNYFNFPNPGGNLSGNGLEAPNLNPSSQPVFNSFYPNESLIAERNYLEGHASPDINAALNAHGIENSGLGAGMQQNLDNYIGTIAPDLTPANAQAADLSRMYGWGVVNGLINDQQLPGATPMSGVSATPNQFIINNEGSPHSFYDPYYPGGQGTYYSVTPGDPQWEVGTYAPTQFGGTYNPYAGPGYQYNTGGDPLGGASSPIFGS